MLDDRYGNALTTSSTTARDAYVEGVDHILAATYGATQAFTRALDADPEFALAEAGLARATALPFAPPGPPVNHGGTRVRLFQTRALR